MRVWELIIGDSGRCGQGWTQPVAGDGEGPHNDTVGEEVVGCNDTVVQ